MKKNAEKIEIHNRKYIGSKKRLLPFIEKVILDEIKEINIFIDGFSGTGVVAEHFNRISRSVIANDILYSNYLICSVFLGYTGKNVNEEKLTGILEKLNSLQPERGYCFQNYGGTYFTFENAGLIDSVREKIEHLYYKSNISREEKNVLITSLIFAADKAANTVGQYDAFLKNIGNDMYDSTGSHKIDSNVYKRIKLMMPNIDYKNNGNNMIYNEDINKLVNSLDGDVLYLDPPYNNRQYADCYHVLENIARWEKPELSGKTKKFKREHLKSSYSKKGKCISAFKELIQSAKNRHIFVSYNSEGIIPVDELTNILKQKGKCKVHKTEYSIFGNGAGRSKKRIINEYIYYCRG
jgi:adenine-specific DNA-methyltransferase